MTSGSTAGVRGYLAALCVQITLFVAACDGGVRPAPTPLPTRDSSQTATIAQQAATALPIATVIAYATTIDPEPTATFNPQVSASTPTYPLKPTTTPVPAPIGAVTRIRPTRTSTRTALTSPNRATTPTALSKLPIRVSPRIPTQIVTPVSVPLKATGSRVIALDPGHGGKETGAVAATGLAEKKVNLQIALKLQTLLVKAGYKVVLTRDSDRAVNIAEKDLNGNGVVDNDDDLQARVDIADAAHADILVSIHNNGDTDRATRGTTIYYCDARPFVSENIRLATNLRQHLVEEMRAAGYSTDDKGIADDAPLKKPYGHLFVLGPLTPRVARASVMPGALGETLYLSNPREAALLADNRMLSAIAQGYLKGIEEYFGR